MPKATIKAADFASLYEGFTAPVSRFDCGRKCAPLNGGEPVCCSTQNAVPVVHKVEFELLKSRTDLWSKFKPYDYATRQIVAGGGQIVKVAPWGRRRLAYPIERYREGSYHIILFDAPATAITELERGLLITEEVLRHLVTRVERPVKAARPDAAEEADLSPEEEEVEDDGEVIDESESEAAPAATD